jgi:hypothetical protein
LEAGKVDAADREVKIQRIERAGIPLKFRKLGRKDYLPKGKILFDYLGTDAYASDLLEGRGVCLSGDPTIRSDLLALMAKSPAIEGRSTVLISLHSLLPVIENNEERRAFIHRADFVMVDHFEREFRSDECPYNYHQLSTIEDFLLSRMQAGKATHFAACRRWTQLKWFSRDFIGQMEPKVIDIKLG